MTVAYLVGLFPRRVPCPPVSKGVRKKRSVEDDWLPDDKDGESFDWNEEMGSLVSFTPLSLAEI